MNVKFQGLAAVLASATLLSACSGSANTASTLPPAPPAPVQGLYLLAGLITGAGNPDGSGSDAHFGNLGGVAADAYGNFFVTDTDFATVRKIDGFSMVTTLAGSVGNFGTADVDRATARFKALGDIGVDLAGNVYVTDGITIRKITPAGAVTTLAGVAGQRGATDGMGNVARFNQPAVLGFDQTGNLFITDTGKHTVRQISPDGRESTVLGQAGENGSATGELARHAFCAERHCGCSAREHLRE